MLDRPSRMIFKILTQYECKEVCAPSQSQVGGVSARPTFQNDIPQQQEDAQLSLPQLNHLFEASFVCDESSVSTADVAVIPSQYKATARILSHWQSFITRLESQEEDAPKRILFFKPMSWLGQIRSHRRDETWSASLWQTFFSTSIPWESRSQSLPRRHSRLVVAGNFN